MAQFYAKADDEERCRDSIRRNRETALTGLTLDGQVNVFRGRVQSVETGSAVFPGYPLRATIDGLNEPNRDRRDNLIVGLEFGTALPDCCGVWC